MPSIVEGIVLDSDNIPVSGATVIPYSTDGYQGSSGTTNANGYFKITGLADKKWIAYDLDKKYVTYLLPSGSEITDEMHGQRSVADAHQHSDLRGIGANDHHDQQHLMTHHMGGNDALDLGSIAGSVATVEAYLDVINEYTDATGVTIDGLLLKDGNCDGRDVSADGTKLDGIEAAADVTDATNVDAAGATMNADTDVSGNGWVLDEDNMASDDATKVATQQSIKAYVDAQAGGANTALSNLASVAINTTLISDTDDTDDLGSSAKRWKDLWITKQINIDSTPDSDHEVSGLCTELTAGASLAFGDFCYIGSDGKMEKTDADAEATSRCVGFCVDTIAENSAGSFLLQGFIRDDTWDFTIGGKVYLDTATAGAVTQTAPSGTDDCIVIVGIALTADVLYFSPTVQAIVEHTG